jgi:hypothetical protein
MRKIDQFNVVLTDAASPKGGAVAFFSDGPYAGVHFVINRVKICENVIDFHYDILTETPEAKSLSANKHFIQTLGDLVVYLLEVPDKIIGKNDKLTPDSHTTKSSD